MLSAVHYGMFQRLQARRTLPISIQSPLTSVVTFISIYYRLGKVLSGEVQEP
jgi:hypothetical protein